MTIVPNELHLLTADHSDDEMVELLGRAPMSNPGSPLGGSAEWRAQDQALVDLRRAAERGEASLPGRTPEESADILRRARSQFIHHLRVHNNLTADRQSRRLKWGIAVGATLLLLATGPYLPSILADFISALKP